MSDRMTDRSDLLEKLLHDTDDHIDSTWLLKFVLSGHRFQPQVGMPQTGFQLDSEDLQKMVLQAFLSRSTRDLKFASKQVSK